MKKIYLAILILGILWGSNFIYMKWAGEVISPGQVAFLRVFFAFVPILGLAWHQKALNVSQTRFLHHFAMLAALATSFSYFAWAKGTSSLPTGVAGVLGATPPIFTVLASHFLLRSERMNRLIGLAIVLGFVGIVVISRPWTAANPGASIDMQGAAWMLSGSIAFGLSYVYVRLFMSSMKIPSIAIVTWQLGIALLQLYIVTDFTGMGRLTSDWRATIGLVAGLGLLGTGVSLFLYFKLLERLSATAASSAIYITPIVSLAIGWLVGERVDWPEAVGVTLLLCCIGLLEVSRQRADRAVAGEFVVIPSATAR